MISYLRNRRTHLSEINPKVLVCLAARIILISYGFSRNIESIMTEITKIIIVNTNEIVTFFDILSLNIVIKKKTVCCWGRHCDTSASFLDKPSFNLSNTNRYSLGLGCGTPSFSLKYFIVFISCCSMIVESRSWCSTCKMNRHMRNYQKVIYR